MARYGALTLQVMALSNLATIGGTNTNIIAAGGTQLLNRVGSGRFTISARDNNTNIQPGRVAYVYITDEVASGAAMDVAAFIIETVETSVTDSGAVLTVSGPSILDQLSYSTGDDNVIDDGAGGATTDDITDIMSYAPAGWTTSITAGGSGTAAGTYHASRGDTVLELLMAAAKQSGEFFRINSYSPPTKVLNWRAANDGSGVTLRMPAAPTDYDGFTNTGIIIALSEDSDFSEVVTRIRPYGAGVGDGRLDITDLTVSDPSGYTTTAASNLIVNTTLESSLGYSIKRDIDFPHIQADDITVPTQLTSAKTALWNEGINYLQERDSSKKFYRIRCIVPADLRPGQTVSVVYSEYQGGISGGSQIININASFVIHEVTNEVGADGIRYTSLLIGEGLRPKPEPARQMATAIDTARKTTRKSDVGTSPGSVGTSRTIQTQQPIRIDGGTSGDLSANRTLTLGTLNGLGTANQVLGSNSGATDIEYKTVTAGAGIDITHGAGSITVTNTAIGSSAAPPDAQYVTLATNATLTNERVLTAGAGLTGTDGGAGSTYTLNVATADTSMTINADSIQVRLAATSGLQISTGLMLADTVAGAGLTIASKVLAVGAGAGLTVNADDVALTTPGTLTVSSSNTATGSHTHAITTSNNPGAAAAILASNSSGQITLEDLFVTSGGVVGMAGTNGRFIFFAGQINTTSADLAIDSGKWIGLGSSSPRLTYSSGLIAVNAADLSIDSGKWVGVGSSSARFTFFGGQINANGTNLAIDSGKWIGLGSSSPRLTYSSGLIDVNSASLQINTSGDLNRRFLMVNSDLSGSTVFYDFNQADRDSGTAGAFEMGFYKDSNNTTQIRMSKEVLEVIIRKSGTWHYPFRCDGQQVILAELPTSNPGIVGALYRSGGTVLVST